MQSGHCSHMDTKHECLSTMTYIIEKLHQNKAQTKLTLSMVTMLQKIWRSPLEAEDGVCCHHTYITWIVTSSYSFQRQSEELANYLTTSSLSITFNALSLSMSKSITGSLDKILLKESSLLLVDERLQLLVSL